MNPCGEHNYSWPFWRDIEASKPIQQRLLAEKKASGTALNIAKLEFPDGYLLRQEGDTRFVDLTGRGSAGLNDFMNQGPYGRSDLWASNAHHLANRIRNLTLDLERLPLRDRALLTAEIDRLTKASPSQQGALARALAQRLEGLEVTNDPLLAVQLIQLSVKRGVIDTIRDFYRQEANSNPPIALETVSRGTDIAELNSRLSPADQLMPYRLTAGPNERAYTDHNRLYIEDSLTGRTRSIAITHNPTAFARWELWQSVVNARNRLLGEGFGQKSRTSRGEMPWQMQAPRLRVAAGN